VRTTVDLDEDVLLAVKERARRERRSAGEVLSQLARQALTRGPQPDSVAEDAPVYGFDPLPHRGPAVSNALVDRLREEDAE
jgi:hypothetical protein